MRRKKKEEEEEKRDGVEKGQLHFSKREGKKKRRSSSSSIERELPIKSKLQPFSFFENVVSLRPSLRHGRLQRLWRYPDDEAEGRASQSSESPSLSTPLRPPNWPGAAPRSRGPWATCSRRRSTPSGPRERPLAWRWARRSRGSRRRSLQLDCLRGRRTAEGT